MDWRFVSATFIKLIGALPLTLSVWFLSVVFGALVAAGVTAVLVTRQNETPVPATALGDKRFYP